MRGRLVASGAVSTVLTCTTLLILLMLARPAHSAVTPNNTGDFSSD
jgi:hypothetical protein